MTQQPDCLSDNKERITLMKLRIPTLLLLLLALLLPALPLPAQSISVRLLNLSDAPLGPVLVATHPGTLSPLFDPSDPPAPALRLFSDGAASMLESEARELARRHPHVRFGVVDGPGPGETVTVEIAATSYHRNVSLAAWLPPSGFAGFHALPAFPGLGSQRHDVPAWEAAGTVLVHRSRPSPIARAWILYRRPEPRGRSSPAPSLTPEQARERAACLEGSATCIWRLEGGRGYCSDCLPPLRPNAARTRCVE